MKEYLLVAKGCRQSWDSLDSQAWESVMNGFGDWVGKMKEKNLWIRGDRLSEKSAEIKKAAGLSPIVDGPFTETKEAITGFFLFRAENYEHAIEISKGCPCLLLDSLVLREIEEQ